MAALPHATDEQAARAIAHVACVLQAAKNGNQHNENMIVLMDQATAMFQRIAKLEEVLTTVDYLLNELADERTPANVEMTPAEAALVDFRKHTSAALSKATPSPNPAMQLVSEIRDAVGEMGGQVMAHAMTCDKCDVSERDAELHTMTSALGNLILVCADCGVKELALEQPSDTASSGLPITLKQYLAASFVQCLSFGRSAGKESRREHAWLMWEGEIVSDDEWAERAAKQFLSKDTIQAAIRDAVGGAE